MRPRLFSREDILVRLGRKPDDFYDPRKTDLENAGEPIYVSDEERGLEQISAATPASIAQAGSQSLPEPHAFTPPPEFTRAFDRNQARFQKQLAEGNRLMSISREAEVEAALDLLTRTEGGQYNKWTGGELFNTFNDHPGFNSQGQSAAGLFQMQQGTFNRMKDRLGPLDFREPSQRLATVGYLDTIGALKPLRSGNFDGFLDQASRSDGWSSLPPHGKETRGLTPEQAQTGYNEYLRKHQNW
jgi:muramidase (phage lysozyme)